MGAPRWLRLGRVVRTQGLRGEIRIDPESGDPSALAAMKQVAWSQGGEPVALRSARAHKRQAVVRPAGVDTVEAAEGLVGREVWARREWLPPAGKGSYYWADLVGCMVEENGAPVGEVTGVEDYGPHAILVVAAARGEGRIPFVEAIVKEVDVAARRIRVEMPPGLLDLEA